MKKYLVLVLLVIVGCVIYNGSVSDKSTDVEYVGEPGGYLIQNKIVKTKQKSFGYKEADEQDEKEEYINDYSEEEYLELKAEHKLH